MKTEEGKSMEKAEESDNVNDVVHCANCGYGFSDCECNNWEPVYGQEIKTQTSMEQAASKLNPYTIPQFRSGWNEGFIAGWQEQNGEIERLKTLLLILNDGQSQSDALGWTKNIKKIKEYMKEQREIFIKQNNL